MPCTYNIYLNQLFFNKLLHRLALNSIVVLHDKKYLCWLNFNDVEQKDLQDRFKPPQLPITIFIPFQGGLIAFCDEVRHTHFSEHDFKLTKALPNH